MFKSAGYFKGVNCPFFASGLCERPYCHFRHVKVDDETDKQSQRPQTGISIQGPSGSYLENLSEGQFPLASSAFKSHSKTESVLNEGVSIDTSVNKSTEESIVNGRDGPLNVELEFNKYTGEPIVSGIAQEQYEPGLEYNKYTGEPIKKSLDYTPESSTSTTVNVTYNPTPLKELKKRECDPNLNKYSLSVNSGKSSKSGEYDPECNFSTGLSHVPVKQIQRLPSYSQKRSLSYDPSSSGYSTGLPVKKQRNYSSFLESRFSSDSEEEAKKDETKDEVDSLLSDTDHSDNEGDFVVNSAKHLENLLVDPQKDTSDNDPVWDSDQFSEKEEDKEIEDDSLDSLDEDDDEPKSMYNSTNNESSKIIDRKNWVTTSERATIGRTNSVTAIERPAVTIDRKNSITAIEKATTDRKNSVTAASVAVTSDRKNSVISTKSSSKSLKGSTDINNGIKNLRNIFRSVSVPSSKQDTSKSKDKSVISIPKSDSSCVLSKSIGRINDSKSELKHITNSNKSKSRSDHHKSSSSQIRDKVKRPHQDKTESSSHSKHSSSEIHTAASQHKTSVSCSDGSLSKFHSKIKKEGTESHHERKRSAESDHKHMYSSHKTESHHKVKDSKNEAKHAAGHIDQGQHKYSQSDHRSHKLSSHSDHVKLSSHEKYSHSSNTVKVKHKHDSHTEKQKHSSQTDHRQQKQILYSDHEKHTHSSVSKQNSNKEKASSKSKHGVKGDKSHEKTANAMDHLKTRKSTKDEKCGNDKKRKSSASRTERKKSTELAKHKIVDINIDLFGQDSEDSDVNEDLPPANIEDVDNNEPTNSMQQEAVESDMSDSNLEAFLNDSDFSDDDRYDECLRIFQESKGREHKTSPEKKKSTKGKKSSAADDVSKKRVARKGDTESTRSQVHIEKLKKTMSAAEVMHNRFLEVQQRAIQAAKAAEKTIKKDPYAGQSTMLGGGKRRLAHSLPSSSSKKSSTSSSKTLITTASKTEKRKAHLPVNISNLKRPTIPSEYGSKVPSNIRQRYLNLIIDETLKLCDSEQEAFDRGQEEELTAYKKSSNKNVYLNVSVNLIKRLRSEVVAPSTSKKAKISALKLSHDAVLGGKHALNTSFTVNRSGGGQKLQQENFKGAELYKRLSPYIMSEESLRQNGFPRPSPDTPGSAVFFTENRHKVNSSKLTNYEKLCVRCGKTFIVYPNGTYAHKEECVYHWGKAWKKKIGGAIDTRYTCCQGDLASEGCSVGKAHAHETNKWENLSGYMKTMPCSPPIDGDYGVFAMDCEMVYTRAGLELARVTVTDPDNEVVYETLVKPDGIVIDHNTRFSGITEEDLSDVTTSLRDVQAVLLSLFTDKTIILGHSLESDFLAVKLLHQTVVDTSVVFPHRMGPPNKRALRTLMAEYMKKIIQDDVGGHDSKEDAVSVMELMHWKLKEDARKEPRRNV